jgi:hypothetical protein
MSKLKALTLGLVVLASPGFPAIASEHGEQKTATAEQAAGVAEFFAVFHEEDGRFYAFGDRKVYKEFVGGREPPYVLTRIGGGPQKQTMTFGMTKDDSKAKIEDLGYMNLYAGSAQPAADFYGEVVKEGRFYVFDDWKDMQGFITSGEAPYIFTHIGKGPKGATLTVVRNKATVKDSAKADALVTHFREMHGL